MKKYLLILIFFVLMVGSISSQELLPKEANIRNNWLSIGYVVGLGGSIRYEYMLNSKFALGVDGYYNNISAIAIFNDNYLVSEEFGANVTARFYPWGKIYYIGVDLGFHGFKDGNFDEKKFLFGFAITPELGFKIDWFNAGGFFWDIGVKVPLIIVEGKSLLISLVPYIVLLGWAF